MTKKNRVKNQLSRSRSRGKKISMNGGSPVRNQGSVQPGGQQPGVPNFEKVPASAEEYTAVQLHQARVETNTLRRQMIEQQKVNLQKDQAIAQLKSRILEMEIKAAEKDNLNLRGAYSLQDGKTIHRDESTGETFWLVEKDAAGLPHPGEPPLVGEHQAEDQEESVTNEELEEPQPVS